MIYFFIVIASLFVAVISVFSFEVSRGKNSSKVKASYVYQTWLVYAVVVSSFICGASAIFYFLEKKDATEAGTFLVLGFFLFLLGGAMYIKTTRIVLSDTFINKSSIFGSKLIDFKNITDFRCKNLGSNSYVEVKDTKGTIIKIDFYMKDFSDLTGKLVKKIPIKANFLK